MRQTGGATESMACIKTLMLNHARQAMGKRQDSADMGKSGAVTLRHGGFAMETCRAPCHSVACPHAALVLSSLS